MKPRPNPYVTAATLQSSLAARDCEPLTAAETATLIEFVRRATGGCVLNVPSDSLPPEKLPAAWLSEFDAIAAKHVARMAAMPLAMRATHVYDPLG